MSTFLKARFTPLLLAGLMAGAGFSSLAQTTPTPPADGAPKAHHGMGGHGHRDPAKMQEMIEKRLADLKASLKIEPPQESAWSAFTTAMKPPADMAQRRDAMRASMEKLSTPERIDHMKAMRTMRDAEIAKREQATKDLYAALTPEQKKTFDTRGQVGRPGHGTRHGADGHGGGQHHAEGAAGHKMGGMSGMGGMGRHQDGQKGGHNHS